MRWSALHPGVFRFVLHHPRQGRRPWNAYAARLPVGMHTSTDARAPSADRCAAMASVVEMSAW